MACFEIVGRQRNLAKSNMITFRMWRQVPIRLYAIYGSISMFSHDLCIHGILFCVRVNSMFSRWVLHTSAHLVFCYVLKWVVLMGSLLSAAGWCLPCWIDPQPTHIRPHSHHMTLASKWTSYIRQPLICQFYWLRKRHIDICVKIFACINVLIF